MKVQVFVRLKAGVLDVQGKAVERGLSTLGIEGVREMRIGRLIEFSVDAPTESDARAIAERLCKELLANTVMEDYEIRIGA